MVKLYLRYNPYRIETEMRLLSHDTIVPISEEAGIMWIAGMRMQRWLSEDCSRDFFEELKNNLGEEEIVICFSGTDQDMEDLTRAADRYMKRHSETRIRIERDGSKGNRFGSEQKIERLNILLREAGKSPYSVIIPRKIWLQLEALRDAKPVGASRIELERWPNAADSLFGKENWQQACIHFPFERMGTKPIRDALYAFSQAIAHNGKREWDRERFLLICECDDAVMADLQRAQDSVKKILLEYGIYDLNVYLITPAECNLLYRSGAQGESSQLRSAKKAMALYEQRYAAQYQLHTMSDALQRDLRNEGFVRNADLFRKVEKIMRGSPKFRNVRDRQIFDGHEWVLHFLSELEHWLDIKDVGENREDMTG